MGGVCAGMLQCLGGCLHIQAVFHEIGGYEGAGPADAKPAVDEDLAPLANGVVQPLSMF